MLALAAAFSIKLATRERHWERIAFTKVGELRHLVFRLHDRNAVNPPVTSITTSEKQMKGIARRGNRLEETSPTIGEGGREPVVGGLDDQQSL